jgi:hypothetical protein
LENFQAIRFFFYPEANRGMIYIIYKRIARAMPAGFGERTLPAATIDGARGDPTIENHYIFATYRPNILQFCQFFSFDSVAWLILPGT